MFINLWITVFVRLYFYVYLFKKSQEKDAQNISPIFRLFNNDTSEELIFLLAMLEVSLLVLIIALFLFFIFYFLHSYAIKETILVVTTRTTDKNIPWV